MQPNTDAALAKIVGGLRDLLESDELRTSVFRLERTEAFTRIVADISVGDAPPRALDSNLDRDLPSFIGDYPVNIYSYDPGRIVLPSDFYHTLTNFCGNAPYLALLYYYGEKEIIAIPDVIYQRTDIRSIRDSEPDHTRKAKVDKQRRLSLTTSFAKENHLVGKHVTIIGRGDPYFTIRYSQENQET